MKLDRKRDLIHQNRKLKDKKWYIAHNQIVITSKIYGFNQHFTLWNRFASVNKRTNEQHVFFLRTLSQSSASTHRNCNLQASRKI